MAKYRAFYLKDDVSRRFRELPAAFIKKQIRARDYPVTAEVEADDEYGAWRLLQDFGSGQPGAPAGRAFGVGDALEAEDARLLLCMFGGFEAASWWVPEPGPEAAATAGEPPPDALPPPPPETPLSS
jgi:hypothetical protein